MKITNFLRVVWLFRLRKALMQSGTTKPLITTKEARKILGRASKSLTNEELSHLVNQLEQMARLGVRDYMVRKDAKII